MTTDATPPRNHGDEQLDMFMAVKRCVNFVLWITQGCCIEFEDFK